MKNIAIACLLVCLSATLALAIVPPLGTWEWVSTENPAGVFTTPADVGYTVQYAFDEDLSFTRFRDQVPDQTGVYWVDQVLYQDLLISRLNLDWGNVSLDRCAYGITAEVVLALYWGAHPMTGLPSFPIERYASRTPVAVEAESWGSVKALFR